MKCFGAILCLLFQIHYLSAYIDIAKMGFEQYQDVFINGKVIQKANNNHLDCNTRYEIIHSILERYNRPFTLLDIGSSQGYYSFRAAFDYPSSIVTMIEGNNPYYPIIGDQLHSICLDNTEINNVIFLNKPVSLKDLQRLGEYEHFDVVLALNIIHWFPLEWKEILEAIVYLGLDIIIETPPLEVSLPETQVMVRKGIIEHINLLNGEIIAKVPRHTSKDLFSNIYLIKGKRTR